MNSSVLGEVFNKQNDVASHEAHKIENAKFVHIKSNKIICVLETGCRTYFKIVDDGSIYEWKFKLNGIYLHDYICSA